MSSQCSSCPGAGSPAIRRVRLQNIGTFMSFIKGWEKW
jgi:hypothetical protein